MLDMMFCRLFFFIGAAAWITASSTRADEIDCWDQNNEVASGVYRFSHKSWAERNGAKFSLVHCVENRGANPIFIDWQDAGIRGYVLPNSNSYTKTSFPAHKFTNETSILWWGPRPDSASTNIFDYNENIVVAGSDEKSVSTSSRRTIPLNVNFSYVGDSLDFENLTEKQFGVLREIDLNFLSEFDPSTRVLVLKCFYQVDEKEGDRGGYGSLSYRIKFSDNDLNVLMFGTSDGIRISGGRVLQQDGFPLDFETLEGRSLQVEGTSLEFVARRRIDGMTFSERSARLEFHGGGKVIGYIPIHYWW
ncbi:hypothetical protein [Sedimentitalea todarodis]|uniref:Uncharacterized protein n=1 Tax=Sedimentitalea todarodis TaxID=1631240 RepID=A0ABU3VLA1_9RHOB|nr:hypothetical protein [Sedimentitalea todarodis]MDU9006964.1 hypothetical protein [Sedimentitalea todarodis]